MNFNSSGSLLFQSSTGLTRWYFDR